MIRRMTCARPGRGLLGLLALLLAAGCGRAAAFDDFARDICRRNDAVDAEARKLPRQDILADAAYLEKVDALVRDKMRLKAEVDAAQPPFSRSELRSKLSIALNNSIRYLRALRAQYEIARQEMDVVQDQGPENPHALGAEEAIQQVIGQRSILRVDPREVLMKQQYDKLYGEVRAELGLEPTVTL